MKFLILGAGPSGLAFANMLNQRKETSFLILEKESQAGGLCRSIEVDNAPLDIGGGHFLDVRHSIVNKFLFQFMPEDEWNKYNRDSMIFINGNTIHHPIEANIWEMEVNDQIKYLMSIASAGCNNGIPAKEKFIDWIFWKLGDRIASEYMIPYNQKLFGADLNKLGTYWLSKLPDVSFEDTLRSCLEKRAYAKQPGHAQFYYPKKYGYGELWIRMADTISQHIEYNKVVNKIDFDNCSVTTKDGSIYKADIIVTTIPWIEYTDIVGMPKEIKNSLSELKYNSVQIEYFSENLATDAQWIYYPDLKLPYHRILVRHNFCPNSKGYWTETNSNRVINDNISNNYKYINQYAYPLNTIEKPKIMKKLLTWAETKKVYGLGRWGEHKHYNSDVTVELAINMADRF